MMIYLSLIIFGILAGISSSLFGLGGGFLIVPIIYHLLGNSTGDYSMYVAVATSTSIIIINSLNATYKQHTQKNINWSYLFPLIIYIALGSLIGVYLTKFMNSQTIRWFFIIFMSMIIYVTIRTKHKEEPEFISLSKKSQIIIGLMLGSISSILGLGGSTMTIPLMRKLGAKMKQAVALANPVSFVIALTASLSYIVVARLLRVNLGAEYFGFIYLPAFFILTACGFIGVAIGSRIGRKLPENLHLQLYIILLIIVLLSMLIK